MFFNQIWRSGFGRFPDQGSGFGQFLDHGSVFGRFLDHGSGFGRFLDHESGFEAFKKTARSFKSRFLSLAFFRKVYFLLCILYRCICRRVAPDYAADLSVPIMDCDRNAKRKGDRPCTVS